MCFMSIFIWVRSRNWGCLATWFCYQLIAKPGNKTVAVSWPDPYVLMAWWCYHIERLSASLGLCVSVEKLLSKQPRCWWFDLKCEPYTSLHWPIMITAASQITSLMVVYSIVYSGADQRKHQNSASLAFVRAGNSPDRWIPRTKGQ